MKLKNIFGTLVVSTTLATMGCAVEGTAHVEGPAVAVEVDEEPPPPQVVVTEVRPGYVSIEGRWVRERGQWRWIAPRWEREQRGRAWEAGRWERRGNKHVWIEGHWRGGGGGGNVHN